MNSTTLAELLETAERTARRAGNILLDWFPSKTAKEKGPKDLVTEADLAAQDSIRDELLNSYPTHGFIGEEGGAVEGQGEFRWIVDPLDGTVNYVHRLPGFAVSIGLQHYGKLVAGVVFDPLADECFAAAEGLGARLNGAIITVGNCPVLSQALVAASFPPGVRRGSVEIERFVEILEASQSVRRMGSAALNLCYVAMGRLDAYWTSCVSSWDIAAGVKIVQEAGGIITDLRGGNLNLERPELLASSQVSLHTELIDALRRADDRIGPCPDNGVT